MWLEIDESLVYTYPHLNESQCAALEMIALSVFHGKNSLFAKKKTLDWMMSQGLSAAAKSVCLKVKNRLSEYSSLRDIIGLKVIIVASNNSLSFNAPDFWELPLNLLEMHPVSTCTLLTENLSDADIYLIAAEHYKKHNKINGLTISLNPVGGGGNQIFPAFMRFIERREGFCLSITDTDRDYPTAESNDTSKSCKSLAEECRWIAAHKDVPARELENILPINIVEDAIFDDRGAVDLHERFEKIKERVAGNPSALLYCDLKMGTKFSWSGTQHGNEEKTKFWKYFLESNNLPLNACEKNCEDQCDCFMIDSLGEKIADKFLNFCSRNSFHKQYERMKTSANASQWLEIGKEVFNWGVATPRTRI